MKPIATISVALLMMGTPTFAADSDRLVRICQHYLDGKPQSRVLILEQLDTEKYSASEFLKAGKRETEKIAFSLKLMEGDLQQEGQTTEQLYEETLKRGELSDVTNHKGDTIQVDVVGMASIIEGNLVFSSRVWPTIRLRNYANSPEYVSVDIDDHFGQGYDCIDWLML